MPFTPIHLGVGALAKSIAPRHFSFQAFVVSQVFMDIEPGVRMLVGSEILHGPTHTYLGAGLIAFATVGAVAVWQRVAPRIKTTIGRGISTPVAAASALIGTMSHVALDAMMHADMETARIHGLPVHEIAGAGPEMICLVAAVAASLIAVSRHAIGVLRG